MAAFLGKRKNFQKRWEPSIYPLFVNNMLKGKKMYALFKVDLGT